MSQQLITHTIDDALAREPDRVWASYAISSDIQKDGLRDVTIAQLAKAVDRLAWHIDSTIGKSTTFETLGYIGLPDVRHMMLLLAAVKTGYKVLFFSHFNSVPFSLSLCEKTDCSTLFYSEGVDAIVNPLLQAKPMKQVLVPKLDDLLVDNDSEPLKPYPYNRSFTQGIDDPVTVFHTSGTTGFPKPVVHTQRSFYVYSKWNLVPDIDGRPSADRLLRQTRRTLLTIPMYHSGGILYPFMEAFYRNKSLVLFPPLLGRIPSTTFEQMFQYADFDCLIGVPVYMEMIAKSPQMLQSLADKVAVIIFIGGALSSQIGSELSSRARVLSQYGTSESGPVFNHVTDPQDWDWLCINEERGGLRWDPYKVQGLDNVYELSFIRTPQTEKIHHAWWHTDCRDVFHTNDLFIKHPTKKHHWKFYARKDDMIVTKFAWNVNPAFVEHIIGQHPAIKHVVVGGMGRMHICALFELVDPDAAPADEVLQNIIRPLVQKSNAIADQGGQLAMERVLLSHKDKPFLLAGKVNVQRAATLKLYEKEIEDMYARLGED
ncbi:transferase [Colletotrichum graminicola]|uniref:Transferase n=1 Tax=Colletotrichum graminicola (strain M1.001 / M2 / FGSC 10212) TaxID=645133 RepID=E3R136_COLGM|nr:transferase [Colletotrichum graminicola M1.001]EFQ36824.1 transferase [Colletotrichum graminicola M1.001]WDK18578.1 transferase [Colletotrichum graminicola]